MFGRVVGARAEGAPSSWCGEGRFGDADGEVHSGLQGEGPENEGEGEGHGGETSSRTCLVTRCRIRRG